MKRVLLECLDKEYSCGLYSVRQGEIFAVPEFEAKRLLADFPDSFKEVSVKDPEKIVLDLYNDPPTHWRVVYKDVFGNPEEEADEKRKSKIAKRWFREETPEE